MSVNEKILLVPAELLLLVSALSWRMWFVAVCALVLIVATVWAKPVEGRAGTWKC